MYRLDWISGYGDADGTSQIFSDFVLIDGLTDHDLEMVSDLSVGQTYTTGGPADQVSITRIQ